MELIEIARENKGPDLLKKVFAITKVFNWSPKATVQEWESPFARLWLWMDGEILVGCCSGQVVFEEASIYYLWIEPQYRRRGNGKNFLTQIIHDLQAKAIERITLEVRASNESALALYHLVGFKEIDRRENYYHQPKEDALIMQLILKGER